MALTDQQYTTAEEKLQLLRDKADALYHLILLAHDGSFNQITLSTQQIEQLVTKYQTQKPSILDLYNDLP